MKTMQIDNGLYTGEDFRHQLDAEIDRATKENLPYAVLACVPQQLSGEDATDLIAAAADSLPELVRQSDLIGLLPSQVLAIGAPETPASGAQALAHRLQNELSIRSGYIRTTKWQAGYACGPEDGATLQELLQSAIDAARAGQRHLDR
ncbi:MAG: GGDEF domain-containing protein [Chloroflexi bacterium]|nr:GGDEF domain-containing protein [Chloroflexota bacterium]